MISRLNGIIIEKQPPYLVLEVQGVGYELQLSMNCFYRLPAAGESTILLTHHWIREEVQQLYGFTEAAARTLFRALIKISGVGPKLALVILSGLTVSQFIAAVEQDDSSRLVKLPGVGKKTAERLMVEMRDRCHTIFQASPTEGVPSSSHCPSSVNNSNRETQQAATAALVALGYKANEAQHLIQQIWQPDSSCETLIRLALRRLVAP
ncbi:MAG: Holliday junction branch migration protein RuvA [Candidatus Symbiodolus clandestinus]